jgi:cobalamin biosynthesis protein CbiG
MYHPALGGYGQHSVDMPNISGSIEEIDVRISTVRENLRELVEQAAAYSGAADDELISQRIAEQEAQLDILTKRRAELASAALDKDN